MKNKLTKKEIRKEAKSIIGGIGHSYYLADNGKLRKSRSISQEQKAKKFKEIVKEIDEDFKARRKIFTWGYPYLYSKTGHVGEFNGTIGKYTILVPKEIFKEMVKLLKAEIKCGVTDSDLYYFSAVFPGYKIVFYEHPGE